MIGGDLPSREIYRSAASIVHQLSGKEDLWCGHPVCKFFGKFQESVRRHLFPLLDKGREGVLSSSTGRLFDAAAFLLDLAEENETEAQAPIALEQAAKSFIDKNDRAEIGLLPFELREEEEMFEVDWRPAFQELIERRSAGEAPEKIAAMFHYGLAVAFAESAAHVAKKAGSANVCLSGGVFVNAVFKKRLAERLAADGMRIYQHKTVHTGDGGLSLGQAVVAAAGSQKKDV
jgi:hydrogenase maturation protein HypF